MFRLAPDLALVQTIDFFTPVVDNPFDFGRIAAANSLSDIYAMGARPLTAMNVVAFPAKDMDRDILARTLKGGLAVIQEAGAVLAGGHSVDDQEFKYGLSVTGLVHPDRIWRNSTAREGDELVLTKPLGIGILATGVKAGVMGAEAEEIIVSVAGTLNKGAAAVLADFSPTAVTDVTGFGLVGHLLEMAGPPGLAATLRLSRVPAIPLALELASMGFVPAGAHSVRDFCKKTLVLAPDLDPVRLDLLFDPQTSGGLLAAVAPGTAEACVRALADAGISASFIGAFTGRAERGQVRIEA